MRPVHGFAPRHGRSMATTSNAAPWRKTPKQLHSACGTPHPIVVFGRQRRVARRSRFRQSRAGNLAKRFPPHSSPIAARS